MINNKSAHRSQRKNPKVNKDISMSVGPVVDESCLFHLQIHQAISLSRDHLKAYRNIFKSNKAMQQAHYLLYKLLHLIDQSSWFSITTRFKCYSIRSY